MLIAGGSGLIGRKITKAARAKGWTVEWLSRSGGDGHLKWSPDQLHIEIDAPREYDVIINLAGENVSSGRWKAERKQLIYNSRIQSAATLYKYISDGLLVTKTFIGASAIGIYSDRPGEILNEASEPAQERNWFVNTVIDWEETHQKISSLGIRTVLLRIGIVLSMQGGVLAELIEKSSLGVLPYFGNGNQFWSWIHIDDLADMFLFAAENEKLEGIYNATAPSPATNKVIVNQLNTFSTPKKLVVSAPKIALQIVMGEMHKIVFESANILPTRMQSAGFTYQYPTLDSALKDLLSGQDRKSAGP